MFPAPTRKALVNTLFGAVAVAAVLLWTWICWQHVLHNTSWLDEGKYLIQGYWAASGKRSMYSPEGSSEYPPLFYYSLGYLQMLFGQGANTGRVFAAVLSVPIALLTLLHVREFLPKHKFAALAALCIFFSNAGVMRYFNTGTPYSYVAALTLLTTLIMFQKRVTSPTVIGAALGTLFFVLYFSRLNMILAIVPFFLLKLALLPARDRLRFATVCLAAFSVLSVAFCFQFEPLMRHHMLTLPVVSKMLRAWGILPDSFAAARALAFWNLEQQFEVVRAVQVFIEQVVVGHGWLFWGSVLGTVICSLSKPRPLLPIFSGVYFLYMSVTHTLGSQTYCPTCVGIYTNYYSIYAFFPIFFGLIFLPGFLTRLLKGPPEGVRLAYGVAASALITWSALSVVLQEQRRIEKAPVFFKQAKRHADVIRKWVPASELLLIGNNPLYAQGAMMADKTFQVTGINPVHSYRLLRPEAKVDDVIEEKVLQQLVQLGKWNETILQYWVNCRYDYIVRGKGKLPISGVGKYFSSSFEKLTEFGAMSIWRRKGPRPASCTDTFTLTASEQRPPE